METLSPRNRADAEVGDVNDQLKRFFSKRRDVCPPSNYSPEAVELREAAQVFGKLSAPIDYDDAAGDAANKRLLCAALAYAERVKNDY